MPRRRDLLAAALVGIFANIVVFIFDLTHGLWTLTPVNLAAAAICLTSFELVRRRYRDE